MVSDDEYGEKVEPPPATKKRRIMREAPQCASGEAIVMNTTKMRKGARGASFSCNDCLSKNVSVGGGRRSNN